ncbi:MAG: DNA-binding response regulator, partial [Acidobacteria bacterium]
ALTRRVVEDGSDPVVVLGEVRVDLSAHQVTRSTGQGDQPVRLTPTEWRVLEHLVRHAGKLVTRQQLLTEIWGPQHVRDTGYLRLYVAQLRKKLEPHPASPRYILTEPGMGYRLHLPPG